MAAQSDEAKGEVHMPRIKQQMADGQVVRLFGVDQLFSLKLIEIVSEHGGFDGLWIDVEHVDRR